MTCCCYASTYAVADGFHSRAKIVDPAHFASRITIQIFKLESSGFGFYKYMRELCLSPKVITKINTCV